MAFRLCWLLLAIFLASCSGGSDSEQSAGTFDTPDPVTSVQPGRYGANDLIERSAVSEIPSSKAQTISLNGNVISFTATAGHLIAYNWATSPAKPADLTTIDAEAAIFYTAYTRDSLPHANRPVTFVFNGGPGGASADLDLDFLGPKSIDPSSTPANLLFIDNPNTLLDRTDLVFVDPVGTGYSAAIRPHRNSNFWGIDSDAKVLRDFITRYININNRQSSPKYIYGVSYGGIRAPIIGRLLIESGTRDYVADPSNQPANILSGLVLNSPMLDYKTDCYFPGVSCGGALPTYAMVADFHKRSTERNGLPIATFLAGVRTFAGDFNKLYNSVFGGVSLKTPDRSGWEAFLKKPEAAGFLNKLFQLTGIGKTYQPGDNRNNNPWIDNPNMNTVQFTEKFSPGGGKLKVNDGRFYRTETIDPVFDRTDVYYDFIQRYQAHLSTTVRHPVTWVLTEQSSITGTLNLTQGWPLVGAGREPAFPIWLSA
ncbi:hypothetical protein LJR231_000212 [Phyllobacterium sp. LjRoot231]|uniref:S10 family serine carboxypeptidase-like protein n=1 Tax=Phyllobacterium sp. LjRoot231 TaxID=3342289 RepID=UPI003ECDC3C6